MVAAGFSGGEAEELRRAMGFKRSVERMDRLESRLRSGMNERGIVGDDQEAIIRGIHSFALYGFPESHAASFALIAYASAFLKAHHPAAFLAGLLNAYPMGFYNSRHTGQGRPAARCRSARRSMSHTRPGAARLEAPRHAQSISSQPCGWACALRADCAGRAGLAIEAEHNTAAFTSVADLTKRVALRRERNRHPRRARRTREHRSSLREDPRAPLWQVAALERDPDSLFAGLPPDDTASPLPEMSAFEETLADYRHSGLTTGPQILTHLRATLRERGILSSAELKNVPDGRRVKTAGQVIVRQRPRSAKGFCFLTLEDETGTSNAILTPQMFRRFRIPLHGSSIVQIEGPIQNQEGVIHVRVQHLEGLAKRGPLPDGHDYR